MDLFNTCTEVDAESAIVVGFAGFSILELAQTIYYMRRIYVASHP